MMRGNSFKAVNIKVVGLVVTCLVFSPTALSERLYAQTTPTDKMDAVMSAGYQKVWNKEVQARIDRDIRTYRMADATLQFAGSVNRKGVRIEQVSHDFLFGSNTFLWGDCHSPHNDSIYSNTFGTLFNAATIAFYWRDLEPTKGQPRFAAGSPYIHRRPAPDPIVAFMNRHNVNINGHCIIYGQPFAIPAWMPDSRLQMDSLFKAHIQELASRYTDKIQRWDVVNECYDQVNRHLMPDDYTFRCYQWANAFFPKSVSLNMNECDMHWPTTDINHYVEIARNLLFRGARINNLGIQSHIMSTDEMEQMAEGTIRYLTPEHIWANLQALSKAERPIYISEVTVCAPDSTPRGLAIQAAVTRNLYRIYFSHPNVRGITWWNMVDHGGFKGEPLYSGIYDVDMRPKPVYHVLDTLIHQEWTTRLTQAPDKNGELHFRGFKGRYRITWTDKKGHYHESFIHLDKDGAFQL